MLTNIISLAPKINKYRSFILDSDLDLISITETWLRTTISNNVIHVPGYKVICKDCMTDIHGGVCLFVGENISYEHLRNYQASDLEVLRAKIRPRHLPRAFSYIVVRIVYDPPIQDNSNMSDYLCNCLSACN